MSNWRVPLADIDLGNEEIDAVNAVLCSRWLSMGPITAEFEQQFAEYVGVRFAFAVTNCTAALHLAHLALGTGPGDAVICPSLTFVATANAIRYTGATPVFADITSADDLNIAPDAIETQIDRSTKGICVVHYGGYPCNMDRIMNIARRYNLYVVEDVAHAPGAATWVSSNSSISDRLIKKRCGSIGDIGCYSFFANKNMVTGEGGMLTTNSDILAKKIELLRSHGMTSLTWDRDRGHSFGYDVVELGFNYRIDEIRSAIGLIQLKKLDGNNRKRYELANIYREKLRDIEEISIPFLDVQALSVSHIFPIILKRGIDRKIFMDFLRAKGIQTSIHYPPIHTLTYHKANHMGREKLAITEDIGTRIVTLPLFSGLSENQINYVNASIRQIMVSKRWIQ